MIRRIAISVLVALSYLPLTAQEAPADWIAASNKYTNLLLAVEMKHTPELGSNEGLSQFDNEVSQPTLADEDQERQETEAVVVNFQERGRATEAERSGAGPPDHDPYSGAAIPGSSISRVPTKCIS